MIPHEPSGSAGAIALAIALKPKNETASHFSTSVLATHLVAIFLIICAVVLAKPDLVPPGMLSRVYLLRRVCFAAQTANEECQ